MARARGLFPVDGINPQVRAYSDKQLQIEAYGPTHFPRGPPAVGNRRGPAGGPPGRRRGTDTIKPADGDAELVGTRLGAVSLRHRSHSTGLE